MNTCKRIFTQLSVLALCSPLALYAQEAKPGLIDPGTVLRGVLDTVLYGFIGICLAIIGYKLFDKVTPFDLGKELAEDQNIAAAIVVGAIMLGICLIVGLTILSP